MNERILVLGIGNTLWADEGFGPKTVARIAAWPDLDDGIEVIDGGTQGLYLLPLVQQADRLLVFDAVDFARRPGEIVILRDEEIPAFFGQRPLSLHQSGFNDVLAAAALTDRTPRSTTLVGVQLQNIDEWGGDLSPAVAESMSAAIEFGRREIQFWRSNSNERCQRKERP